MEAWQITAEFAIKWSTTKRCCLPAWSKHLLLQSQTRVIKCHLITLLDWHSSAIHLQHLKTVNVTARKADVATHTQTHTQSVAYVCVCTYQYCNSCHSCAHRDKHQKACLPSCKQSSKRGTTQPLGITQTDSKSQSPIAPLSTHCY